MGEPVRPPGPVGRDPGAHTCLSAAACGPHWRPAGMPALGWSLGACAPAWARTPAGRAAVRPLAWLGVGGPRAGRPRPRTQGVPGRAGALRPLRSFALSIYLFPIESCPTVARCQRARARAGPHERGDRRHHGQHPAPPGRAEGRRVDRRGDHACAGGCAPRARRAAACCTTMAAFVLCMVSTECWFIFCNIGGR